MTQNVVYYVICDLLVLVFAPLDWGRGGAGAREGENAIGRFLVQLSGGWVR